MIFAETLVLEQHKGWFWFVGEPEHIRVFSASAARCALGEKYVLSCGKSNLA